MYAEDTITYYCGYWKTVKTINKGLPKPYRKSPFTFIIKSINLVKGRTLMITSQQKKVFRKFDFVRKQQSDCFDTKLSSVNVVTKK